MVEPDPLEATNTAIKQVDDGEHCQVCGDAYTDVYRLPDEWWALVTPKPEHPDAGLLCPSCALSRLLSTDAAQREVARLTQAIRVVVTSPVCHPHNAIVLRDALAEAPDVLPTGADSE